MAAHSLALNRVSLALVFLAFFRYFICRRVVFFFLLARLSTHCGFALWRRAGVDGLCYFFVIAPPFLFRIHPRLARRQRRDSIPPKKANNPNETKKHRLVHLFIIV